ncbi:methylmalonyl-CoA epimerase [Bhargavaea ginsengi]|uniref:Methylmalonyl-CoA epimerase n=1 Tax=Bhargavaea ginsengi TaxID=426757 RepID=A0A1H6ZML9_9BACL|nr:VOC family protein [Bhargavaea ginsengi]SEJ54508.1 methylmalonyl-CoA epimerase [Bhargavaea ginsengi]
MGETTIGQIGLPAEDIGRAVEFYSEKLGLPLLFNTEKMAFFTCGGVRLMLAVPEHEAFASSGSVIYFNTDDIHARTRELQGAGVPFMGEPHMVAKMGNTETWMAFFADTEGNHLALMSEVPADGPAQ